MPEPHHTFFPDSVFPAEKEKQFPPPDLSLCMFHILLPHFSRLPCTLLFWLRLKSTTHRESTIRSDQAVHHRSLCTTPERGSGSLQNPQGCCFACFHGLSFVLLARSASPSRELLFRLLFAPWCMKCTSAHVHDLDRNGRSTCGSGERLSLILRLRVKLVWSWLRRLNTRWTGSFVVSAWSESVNMLSTVTRGQCSRGRREREHRNNPRVEEKHVMKVGTGIAT